MALPPVTIAALITLCAFLAFWIESRVPAISKMGSSLIALVLGAALSNTGVLPAESPVYDVIAGPVTLLAIAWLLLAVNLRDLKLAGARMMGAFGIAVLGTVLGAFFGAFVFADALGDDAWRLAGTLTGTYSGGSLNFTAVGRAVELPAAIFLGANASDAMLTGLWLGVTILLPGVIGRFYPAYGTRGGGADGEGPVAGVATSTDGEVEPSSPATPANDHPFFRQASLSALDLARTCALGIALLALAEIITGGLAALEGDGRLVTLLRSVPSVLWLTTLALVAGHVPATRRPPGAMVLGSFALHLFFVLIGVWSRFTDIVEVGPAVFLYTLLVIAVHGAFVFGVGRLVRLDIASLAVGSQAAVGGPASAVAIAVARRWPALVLPGIVVGLLGYAAGTYLGLAVAALTRVSL